MGSTLRSSNCQNCGANVEFTSHWKSKCSFCGTENVYDLTHWTATELEYDTDSLKPCPRCECKEWQELHLEGPSGEHKNFLRCENCQGIFLNTRLLQALVEEASKEAPAEDKWLLQILAEDQPFKETRIQYLSCPQCEKHMARRNFGRSSGVIVDVCPDHGTWLDAGELGKIKKWAQAGGKARQQRIENENTQRAVNRVKLDASSPSEPTLWSSSNNSQDIDLYKVFSNFVSRFF